MPDTAPAVAAERAAIHRYVFEFTERGEDLDVSTFRALVRDARQIAGRDIDDGTPVDGASGLVWPACLLYLVLLDQVGKVICPDPRRASSASPLRQALADFAPELREQDRDMLYALRNAFAHEYALANEGKKGLQDDPLRHRFQLAESEDRLLVAYPEKSWNGVYGAESEGGPTEVNLSELQVLVERVIARIERAVLAGSLRLVVGVSPQMVLARWGFRVRNDLPRRPTSPAF